jgi:23S rRNA U2552 (ribose-2'-O)-methylase RlmE/FtsJ
MDLLDRLRWAKHNNFVARLAASRRGRRWKGENCSYALSQSSETDNPLRDFFYSRKQGRGIWKWDHYFEIYHRHFSAFRNTQVNVVEVGVLGGGSLDMWKEYFGPRSVIVGVDIEPKCMAYEEDRVKVFIGNQRDRSFWKDFREKVPKIDIVIDDGCHMSEHQITTLEELLPCIGPGGIYLCEDVHGESNAFSCYVQGLVSSLNRFDFTEDVENPERRLVCKTSPVQQYISSISLYPFVTVIERSPVRVPELVAPMHGTEWQPSTAA